MILGEGQGGGKGKGEITVCLQTAGKYYKQKGAKVTKLFITNNFLTSTERIQTLQHLQEAPTCSPCQL